MPEYVGYDCRPGDMIETTNWEGERRNARVLDTFPSGVRLQFQDAEPEYISYESLIADRAEYVAKCDPVRRPQSWSQ